MFSDLVHNFFADTFGMTDGAMVELTMVILIAGALVIGICTTTLFSIAYLIYDAIYGVRKERVNIDDFTLKDFTIGIVCTVFLLGLLVVMAVNQSPTASSYDNPCAFRVMNLFTSYGLYRDGCIRVP